MRKVSTVLFVWVFAASIAYGQSDSLNKVSEQIKNERDIQLQKFSNNLKTNDSLVSDLNDKLSSLDPGKTKERLKKVEELQGLLNDRLQIIENAPKIKAKLNGQLAFTELLSIQRDIQPAKLFLSSKNFFQQLGSVSDLQSYSDFTTWKSQFDNWYRNQKDGNKFYVYLNQAVNLVSNGTKQIPLYGSFVQTVTSGIGTLLSSFGKKDNELAAKTPPMLTLLNATSQFEQQKSILDHEWEMLNKELEELQAENVQLITDQLTYYNLDANSYKKGYLDETLDTKRDDYKNSCRQRIDEKLTALDQDNNTKRKWQGEVETYMYKVQSLRTRFGVLTSKMLTNIDRYNRLIDAFSTLADAPAEFKVKIQNLRQSLNTVKENFLATFNPAKYIEDSAVMYIERKTV